jgi:hypothetical protein
MLRPAFCFHAFRRDTAATFFSVCTETRNTRAQACYRKVGLVIARTFVEDGREHHFLTRPRRSPV